VYGMHPPGNFPSHILADARHTPLPETRPGTE
jgi:hypothetical protein